MPEFMSSEARMLIFICALGILAFLVFLILFLREWRNRKLLKTVTKLSRGTKSERDLVLELLKNGIPPEAIFHDLYIRRDNGTFSQIDLVVMSRVGVIVIEVKDYSGWIFGSGRNSQWTQVLAYGKVKYRFYNPILQKNGHVRDLKKRLKQFQAAPFYSVVVFFGDCELKDISNVPEGTFLTQSHRIFEVIQFLESECEPARYTNKDLIIRILQESVSNGDSKEIQMIHIDNVEEMLRKRRAFD